MVNYMSTLHHIFKPDIVKEGKALSKFHTLDELKLEQSKLHTMLFKENLKSISEMLYEQIQIVECAISILEVDNKSKI